MGYLCARPLQGILLILLNRAYGARSERYAPQPEPDSTGTWFGWTLFVIAVCGACAAIGYALYTAFAAK